MSEQVRDFHYISQTDMYVLCGSRGTGSNARAFVAIMPGTFNSMRFMEYPEASTFYSIWGDHNLLLGFYVCGIKNDNGVNYGVIASVNRTTLQLSNLHKTVNNWEYHKIILKINTGGIPLRFVVSGRNTEGSRIGYTEFVPNFSSINAYQWAQNTDPASLCVVSDYVLENDKVILASSRSNIVTLTPVSISAASGIAYHFTNWWADIYRFYVQDILTIEENNDIRISVAGYVRTPAQHQAWYGDVTGLSGTSTLSNHYYYDASTLDPYEHYKVRYHNGETYTGGFVYSNTFGRVLFGTPLMDTGDCDDHYYNLFTSDTEYVPSPLSILPRLYSPTNYVPILSTVYQTNYTDCQPFKKEEPAPELLMSVEDESEIITFYDRITIKDTPPNTNYQIYTITGQLLQTGAATPDISTALLSKGFYILRLENGKTFKFVKY